MSTVINFSGSGGGAALNYDVIGSTSTPAPSENLIWVNTENTITSHIFSSSEPESPTEGMVWFNTGATSNVAFSVTEENPIYVYPNSCKQYISNEWVSKSAKSYLNGAWVDWIVRIYSLGDADTFKSFGQSYGSESGIGPAEPNITYTYNTNHLRATISNVEIYQGNYGNRSGCIVTNNAFNLTGINTITFDFAVTIGNDNTSINFCKFYVSTSNSNYDEGRDKSTGNIGSSTTRITLDVSNLSGDHYIGALLKAGASAPVTTTLTLNSIVGE